MQQPWKKRSKPQGRGNRGKRRGKCRKRNQKNSQERIQKNSQERIQNKVELDYRMKGKTGWLKKFMTKTPFHNEDYQFFVVGCQKLFDEDIQNFAEVLFLEKDNKKPVDNLLSIFDVLFITTECSSEYDVSFQCIIPNYQS